jgi:flagellar biosynthesis protein FlhA
VFGLEGKWVPAELRHQAEISGATVVDRASVVITHLAEVVRNNASRLLGREDVRSLTEVVKRTHPVVVEELTPSALSLGEVQRVLHALLDEAVPIRDLVRIFEAMSLTAKASNDRDVLVEGVRSALGPAIASQYVTEGMLPVITFEPQLEQSLLESLRITDTGVQLSVDTARAESIFGDVSRISEAAEQQGVIAVLVCSPQLRGPVRRMLQVAVPRLPVLSYTELAGSTARIETVGVVTGAYAHAA